MSSATDNDRLFDAGWKKAKQIIAAHIYDQLCKVCDELVQWPPKDNHRGWKNLTGNTVTSYACGLYIYGDLQYVVVSGDTMPQPVRQKLKRGEYFTEGTDYDGDNRSWGPAPVDTDGGFGQSFSIAFLENYISRTKNGFEIVMCTGTEYSTYLENVRGVDVLTNTFEAAKKVLATNIKPIKK